MHTLSYSVHATNQDIPTAVPSLLEAALATFDIDRDASRRYLTRASVLLRVKRAPSTDPDIARPPQSKSRLMTWQLSRVIDHIEAHLAAKITIVSLASLISVSSGYLSRAFKSSVGVAPARYIIGRRVQLACEIMRTTRAPLSDVALACGLADQSHLCRLFRRGMGISPSRWRRQYQKCDSDNSVVGAVTPAAVDSRPRLYTNNFLFGSSFTIDNPWAVGLRMNIAERTNWSSDAP
jgi:transcriptional regulator GlxA family with amidase domain